MLEINAPFIIDITVLYCCVCTYVCMLILWQRLCSVQCSSSSGRHAVYLWALCMYVSRKHLLWLPRSNCLTITTCPSLLRTYTYVFAQDSHLRRLLRTNFIVALSIVQVSFICLISLDRIYCMLNGVIPTDEPGATHFCGPTLFPCSMWMCYVIMWFMSLVLFHAGGLCCLGGLGPLPTPQLFLMCTLCSVVCIMQWCRKLFHSQLNFDLISDHFFISQLVSLSSYHSSDGQSSQW